MLMFIYFLHRYVIEENNWMFNFDFFSLKTSIQQLAFEDQVQRLIEYYKGLED